MEVIAPVEFLRRQYIQLIDPEELRLPSNDLLRLPDIQAQIYSSMFHESSMTYAPPERYRFRVLRRLVKALENAIEDPEEDVGASFPLKYFRFDACSQLSLCVFQSCKIVNFQCLLY